MIPQMRKRSAAALIAALACQPVVPIVAAARAPGENDNKTTTPIKHVIVIIGENRSFDHVYATYKPKAGQTVDNLLSKKIIKADGTPGLNYSQSGQYSAVDFGGTGEFPLVPRGEGRVFPVNDQAAGCVGSIPEHCNA